MDTETLPAPDAPEATAPPALAAAVRDLVPLLYAELRRSARRERRRLHAGDTLATTALVNEMYARLARSARFQDRGHFLRVAAIAMRRILIERVRAQLAQKRGGALQPVPLDEAEGDLLVEDDVRLAAIDDALQRLAQQSPRLVDIVECRFFAGYTEQETATALGVSERTVQRDWATARAWLQRELDATH